MGNENMPQTPQESLEIITSMIKQAKGNMKANSFFLLLWGWVVSLASLGMFVLIQMNYSRPWLVWTLTIPAWLVTLYTIYAKERKSSVTTHFDIITSGLWLSYGVVIFTFVFFMQKVNFQLMPVILVITAIPATVSGIILKFRIMIFGGITFWIAGILSFMVPFEYQYLIGAVAIILGYLVPGYVLRKKNTN